MMDLEEYILREKEIRKEADDKLRELAREYAFSNSSVKVGDIVADHFCKIRVEKIRLWFDRRAPSCLYEGPELRKDLTPRKDGRTATVFQSNIKP